MSKIKIKAEWEDLIWKNKDFIQELGKVQDNYFKKLWKKLKKEGAPPALEDWLFDYIYNWTGKDDGDFEDGFEDYLYKHGKVKLILKCHRCGITGPEEVFHHEDGEYCPNCPAYKDIHASLSTRESWITNL